MGQEGDLGLAYWDCAPSKRTLLQGCTVFSINTFTCQALQRYIDNGFDLLQSQMEFCLSCFMLKTVLHFSAKICCRFSRLYACRFSFCLYFLSEFFSLYSIFILNTTGYRLHIVMVIYSYIVHSVLKTDRGVVSEMSPSVPPTGLHSTFLQSELSLCRLRG